MNCNIENCRNLAASPTRPEENVTSRTFFSRRHTSFKGKENKPRSKQLHLFGFVSMDVEEATEEVQTTDSLKCELNTLSRADGSCILCQSDTVIAAAIYGPVEVKQHKMHIDKAYIEVIFKPKCGPPQIGEKLRESIIGKICETAILTSFYPRTAIYIILQDLQSSRDALACSINSTCLALIHAGISMNFLFAAVTSSVRLSKSTPTNSEEAADEATVTFVFQNTSENILAVDSCGMITEKEYQECLNSCRSASKVIFKFYKDMISKYALKM